MNEPTKTRNEPRLLQVRRIFEESGFGNIELLDEWDGHELEDLRDLLSDEEFQQLLDELQDQDGLRSP